jgi:hypothetical protein
MKIVDMSHVMNVHTPGWVGYAGNKMYYAQNLQTVGIVAQRIDTAMHVGTHFDGAMHATDDPKGDMAHLPMDYLVNRGVVVDISKHMTDWAVSKTAGAVFAHYGRYVGPGDHRVASDCRDPMLRVTAFISEKNKRCVVVVVNNANQAKDVQMHVDHPPWNMKPIGGLMTDERRTFTKHTMTTTDYEGTLYGATIPAMGLCTFVWSHEPLPSLTLPDDIHLR